MSSKKTAEERRLDAAMDNAESAFKELLGIDVKIGLQLIAGLFVVLVEELARRKGHDPAEQIRIDSGGKRDITIHAQQKQENT